MNDLRARIADLGLDEARRRASSARERKLIDLAAELMGEENQDLGITYAGFCMTALPHRDVKTTSWERANGRCSLLIEAGKVFERGHWVQCGIPFGSRARLILLFIQTEALRTNSRQISLGRSMYDWLGRLDISIGGKSYSDVSEQARRLSACQLSFGWSLEDGVEGFTRENIVKGMLLVPPGHGSPDQPMLWEERAELTESFFSALKNNPVSVWAPAIRRIHSSSAVMDVYVWLCYRLSTLSKPQKVSWEALKAQFGPEYREPRQFKWKFTAALREALTVYPDANVAVEASGVTLRPSGPPVPERKFVAIGGGPTK